MSRYSRYNDDANHDAASEMFNTKRNDKKSCRACNDFRDWLKGKEESTKKKPVDDEQKVVKQESNETTNKTRNCPLYRDELGRNTWSFLHTMAAYYPEKASQDDEIKMKNFIDGLAKFFPCEECSSDFQQEIEKNPPRTKTRYDLSQWFCEQHNTVNRKLNKPEFDCSKVFERWKDGWKDGSCD